MRTNYSAFRAQLNEGEVQEIADAVGVELTPDDLRAISVLTERLNKARLDLMGAWISVGMNAYDFLDLVEGRPRGFGVGLGE